jgi:NADH-quinone oxidoreductase subunit C
MLNKNYLNIAKILKKYIKSILIKNKIWYITVSENELLVVLKLLKTSKYFQMKQLLDIWVIDNVLLEKRLLLNYLLNSIKYNQRIILRVSVEKEIDTVETLYPSAGWLERECGEMFGIAFKNSADTRRLLTDYGFKGYPLLKEYPVTGYVETIYDDETNRVVSVPLDIVQGLRNYTRKSAW